MERARKYDKRTPKEQLYIACEELDFSWYKNEIDTVRKAWEEGLPLWEIADKLHRTQEEVLILLLDLKIEKRAGWVYGKVG